MLLHPIEAIQITRNGMVFANLYKMTPILAPFSYPQTNPQYSITPREIFNTNCS